jgi:hypothetical protein
MPDPAPPGLLGRPAVIIAATIAAIIGLAVVVLAAWDIPAPKTRVEKVIPNDRLPR